eukprot:TRINITY_DN2239_c0_g1_i1.p1 TRINITY_DN2239_c0_g1~~TRINITY_DN2239_c0_g1_i1.p1  ORF type:complete len:232 (-),score=51.12 TRINITY_DN2239_c0_g1_i1:105-722(-)
MSILEHNGGCCIAMVGKNCIAIGSDKRLGESFQTVSMDFTRVFKMNDKVFLGLAGLGTDVQTFHKDLRFTLNMYKMSEERDMGVKEFDSLVSSKLYERRFGPYFVEPVIAGLREDGTGFVDVMDTIGAPVESEDGFVVAGTCHDNLLGMCESLYRKDMDEDELFETISQCLLSAQDRDALSGWGAVIHLITPNRITTKHLKSRMD